jgi:hypothetical protein
MQNWGNDEAFATRLIYDAAAAAKKKDKHFAAFTCFRAHALTGLLATHLVAYANAGGFGPPTGS